MKKLLIVTVACLLLMQHRGNCQNLNFKSLVKTFSSSLNKYAPSKSIESLIITSDEIDEVEKILKVVDPQISISTLLMLNIHLNRSMQTAKKRWDNHTTQLKSSGTKYKLSGYENYKVSDPSFGATGRANIYHMVRMEFANKVNEKRVKVKLTVINIGGILKIADLEFITISSPGFTNADPLTKYFLESLNEQRSFEDATILFATEQDIDSIAVFIRTNDAYQGEKTIEELKKELKDMNTYLKATWSSHLNKIVANNLVLKYKGFEQQLGTDDIINYRNIGIFCQDKTTMKIELVKFAAIEINGTLKVVQLDWIYPFRM